MGLQINTTVTYGSLRIPSHIDPGELIFRSQNTNVVKFYSLLKKDDESNQQLCYYQVRILPYNSACRLPTLLTIFIAGRRHLLQPRRGDPRLPVVRQDPG